MLEGIKQAALLIAYDNGTVNRFESEEQYLIKIAARIDAVETEFELEEINDYLLKLSGPDLNALCTGSEDEVELLMRNTFAPEGTDELLEYIFDS